MSLSYIGYRVQWYKTINSNLCPSQCRIHRIYRKSSFS